MSKSKKPRSTMDFPVINYDAAGVDIGAECIYIAVPPDRSEREVRSFRTFTPDLREAASWMLQCGVKTVAMESTGVYWIPFFQILEDNGITVFLVNARQVKNVPAAFKTDRRDSKWLRNLHAVGLLSTSFRPEQAVCTIRSITRHRDALVKSGSRHVLHMQKALSQMNVLVHEVLTDITGVSGLAVLDAILAGERDSEHLLRLFSKRVKASEEEIKKALIGDWREEHLFTLKQSLASWRHFQQQIAECDDQILHLLSEYEPAPLPPQDPPVSSGPGEPKQPRTARQAMHDRDRNKVNRLKLIFGVDLTAIPAIAVGLAERIFTEVGPDLSRFPTANHFASWLGLAPNNSESGGKVLSRKTRRLANRLAMQLRLAATSLSRGVSYLAAYLRKMKARLGAPKAITATAHKLARIIYTIITTKQPYDESVFAKQQIRYQEQRLNHLKREAAAFGYEFVQKGFVS